MRVFLEGREGGGQPSCENAERAQVFSLVWICHELEFFRLGIFERADLARSQDVFCKPTRFLFAQAPAYEAAVSKDENFAILTPPWNPPCIVKLLGIWCETRPQASRKVAFCSRECEDGVNWAASWSRI